VSDIFYWSLMISFTELAWHVSVTKAARGTPKRSGNLGSDDGEKASPKTGRGARTKMKSSKLAYMQGEVNESAHRKSRRGK
jgi:hypothetical protein